ncbi:MAG: ATPase, T2SS/T4P/T4SS family [Gemmatimonadaceae bacterium]|jgi:type II secretory ATPase GspE/PulE/Tfp pilus assembly ATPase PilB-like protein/8-oxo-dGTP pyrophosphatase MutT (NUDIX family)
MVQLLDSPSDAWVMPALADITPRESLASLEVRGPSIWKSAVSAGIATDMGIVEALAARTRIPVANGLLVSGPALDLVPERLARRFSILPLTASDTVLEIATSNPYDLDCEQVLAFAAGRTVRMLLASPDKILDRIEEVYAPVDRVNKLIDKPRRSPVPSVIEKDEDADLQLDEKEAERPVIKLVDHIVAEGIAAGASDIHLEAGETGIAVRYRIDGMLKDAMLLPKPVGVPLVSRIKIMSQMDIADRLRPQGGRARVSINGARVDLRVSTLPASHGEKVVIRILDSRAALRSVESLGLDPVDGPRMQKLLDVREGLILVTGPTGSGKTTTLYAALRLLLNRGVNIITVEDPVEYRIPGIVQVQIHEKAGLTFASALRSVLRQDPDVVLIGEIRDRETAAIAIQASLTGHLVFATLHTNDACSSIIRLTDLGVDAGKLAGALKGVVAQRLIRRLCRSCRLVANAGVPRRLVGAVPADAMIYIPVGCVDCSLTGYSGRVAVTEVLVTTPEIERAIADNAPPERLQSAARTSGTRSLWECGCAHLISGDTSAEELVRVIEPETSRADYAQSSARNSPSPVVYEKSTYAESALTKIKPGVVEIFVIRHNAGDWRVLVLQRAADGKRPNSWETVYGKIDAREKPEKAAVRELKEETGLAPASMYNVTVNPFYLHASNTVQMCMTFAAFVPDDAEVTIGEEHQRFDWLSLDQACERFTWPREAHSLRDAHRLLGAGDAGPVEDVLRIKL